MKAILTIKFIEVNNQRATKKMMEDKKFMKTTEKTIRKLSETIDRYLSDYNIKTKTEYKII